MIYDIPKPHGYEFVPPPEAVPENMLLNKFTIALLKGLKDKGAAYEGGLTQSGERHGKGKLSFIDGTYYEGEWVDGHKCGQGEFRYADGTLYKGSWESDVRHGSGTLYMTTGDVIEAIWDHDRKNGPGFLVDKDGKREAVVFYYDLQVKTSE